MSSEFMRRLEAKAVEDVPIPEHLIWRLTKNGRLAEARTRIVPIGNGRPELRIYVQHPTPEFQLGWSKVVTTDEELESLAPSAGRANISYRPIVWLRADETMRVRENSSSVYGADGTIVRFWEASRPAAGIMKRSPIA